VLGRAGGRRLHPESAAALRADWLNEAKTAVQGLLEMRSRWRTAAELTRLPSLGLCFMDLSRCTSFPEGMSLLLLFAALLRGAHILIVQAARSAHHGLAEDHFEYLESLPKQGSSELRPCAA
jgi:hypothetical protein